MKEDVEEKREYENSIYPTLMVTQGTFYTFVGVAAIYSDIPRIISSIGKTSYCLAI